MEGYIIYQKTRHRTTLGTWQRLLYQIPRWARYPLVGIIAVCAALGLLRGMSDLRDQHIKTFPTNFEGLHGGHHAFALQPPEQALRTRSGPNIDQKYTYLRQLGHGQEGSTALYGDTDNGQTVVLKTFTAVSRNPLPASLAEDFEGLATTWPSEIEASISLRLNQSPGLVPILDYFIIQDETGAHSWVMVTPYISNGTLASFAKREGVASRSSASQLDAFYRPALDGMLRNLAPIHAAGFCHDDIKPDNIFIQDSLDWLLGDFGNFRHVDHHWHDTRSWKRQNQWPDCRLNDIRRALKSYLWFLRMASADTYAFDHAFWDASEDWARSYWTFVESPQGLESLELESAPKYVSVPKHPKDRDGTRAMWTERELLCTGIPSRLWEWWDYLDWL